VLRLPVTIEQTQVRAMIRKIHGMILARSDDAD
jgi:hypothetical protein